MILNMNNLKVSNLKKTKRKNEQRGTCVKISKGVISICGFNQKRGKERNEGK